MAYKSKKQEIEVPRGCIRKLAKSFGCTPGTASMALKFASNSEQANIIRDRALKEFGGRLVTKTY